ncbi:MAG TPA: MFS transporter [Alphaproteobacteria bacterium]
MESSGELERPAGSAATGRRASIAIIAFCQVAAMAVWFSASAVVPALRAQAALDDATASLFTSAVQLGFVAGTLASATLGLADRLDPRRYFMASAIVAAAANAAILLFEPTAPAVIALRFATGACMAGIYPVGMKLATTWARDDMGFMVGLLVGAVTLGSASPHLFNALGGIDWRFTLIAASLSALVAAAAIRFAGIGPNIGKTPPFDPRLALKSWAAPASRLANFGYLGHMWELYAMWAWIGVFFAASFRESMAGARADSWAAVATFATVGAGAIGCIVGGALADRVGRTTVTIVAMAVSGGCALVVGFLYGAAPWALVALCLVWGVAIVADSAQFSASIAELSDRTLVGTALTVQTCLGFLLTLLTVHLIPPLVAWVGWRYAFIALAPGPALGVLAMWRLRRHPDAVKIAGGRR